MTSTETMDLAQLARRCGISSPSGSLADPVVAVAYDSRQVTPGCLFVAIGGLRSDGNDFVEDAVARGAIAVVSERPAPGSATTPWFEVADARAFLARAARELVRRGPIPRLVGVTGTKGKTTTTHAIAHVLSCCGRPAGVLGTVSYQLGSRTIEAPRTTPEAPDVEGYLQEMSHAGLDHCAMEVSSHAITLERVAELPFSAAVFTNLGRDHLDFHGSEEGYYLAKRRLFERLDASSLAVLNADDPRSADIAAATAARVVRYGRAAEADVRIEECVTVKPAAAGSTGIVVRLQLDGPRTIETRLLGAINAHNVAAALAAVHGLGVDAGEACAALATFEAVAGRMEPIWAGQEFICLVDYAHTPEALQVALAACREMAQTRGGEVIVVMGCGGDRDRGKRPLMGAAAVEGADHCFVTSDNPRGEDPLTIILDVELGIKKAGRSNYSIVPERRLAIQTALSMATPADVVLIAGKGHERTQTSKQGPAPFDDRDVAREEIGLVLKEKGEGK